MSMLRHSHCQDFSCDVLAETNVQQACRTALDKLQGAALSILFWQLKASVIMSCLSKAV